MIINDIYLNAPGEGNKLVPFAFSNQYEVTGMLSFKRDSFLQSSEKVILSD